MAETQTKQRVLSGIQPSGFLHLGNYVGALRRFVELQDRYEGYFFLADLHAVTVPQDPVVLQSQITRTAATYLACGLDPAKAVVFRQSDIAAHAELGWLLTTLSSMGELSRMTQFKDKSGQGDWQGIGAGLLTYPSLMAADILLYQADLVPVGHDQKQHVELTRDLAERFNHRFGDTLKVPEPLIEDSGARIMGLDDPTRKMSKSAASGYNYIALTDDAETVKKKLAKAVTDSGAEVTAGDDKPAVTNLLTLYSLLSGSPVSELESRYAGKGYGDFKADLADVIIATLQPIQTQLAEYENDSAELDRALTAGADRARPVAEATLAKAKAAMGL